MLTDEELNELLALCNKATAGPIDLRWESCDCDGDYPCPHGDYVHAVKLPEPVPIDGRAETYRNIYSEVSEFPDGFWEWVSKTHTALRPLIEEIQRLRSSLTSANEEIARLRGNLEAVKFQLGGHLGTVTDVTDVESWHYNAQNALSTIRDALSQERRTGAVNVFRLKHRLEPPTPKGE